MLNLIEAVERQNVIMRTVRAGEIDLSTPTGRMLARILSATAQAEGEVKADRWSRSWRQGREQGKPARTGSRLFGYERDGNMFVIDLASGRERQGSHCPSRMAPIFAASLTIVVAAGVLLHRVTVAPQTGQANWAPRGERTRASCRPNRTRCPAPANKQRHRSCRDHTARSRRRRSCRRRS